MRQCKAFVIVNYVNLIQDPGDNADETFFRHKNLLLKTGDERICGMEGTNKILNDNLIALREHGRFVDSYSFYNYQIILYSLKRDFFELLYDNDENKIVWIMIANDHDLKKYLNRVKLNSILRS